MNSVADGGLAASNRAEERQLPSRVRERFHELGLVGDAQQEHDAGFRVEHRGRLHPLAGSTRALSGTATDPAQVEFNPAIVSS
jgi:hypothetical protein